MKRKVTKIAVTLIIYGVWQYVFYRTEGGLTFEGVIISLIFVVFTWAILGCFKAIKWRIDNGVDWWATLETDPEKIKARMLFIMQYGHSGGVDGALKEFNDIFRNYPQWHFENWIVFRAWYKDLVDHALDKPEIYILKMKDGSEYSKENDQLYDPKAPDWAKFDRYHTYDIDDIDDDYPGDDDDIFDNEISKKRKAPQEGLGLGMGLGISDNPVDNIFK